MYRLFARFVPVLVLMVAATACGNGDNNSTPTTPDQTPTITEPFEGVLGLNGAFTHPFTVAGATTITAQLISLSPDSTLTVGLALGTWNGSICQIVLSNDTTKQGDVVQGATQSAGNFCVRIYDASGILTQAQAYFIEVFHQ
jgi:hypothetical protein